MGKLSKISRRAFAFGLASSGVCQAAQPLIDLTEKRSPILNFNAKDALSSSPYEDLFDIKNSYFDPEPALELDQQKSNTAILNKPFYPSKDFNLVLVNANTGEKIKQRFITNSFFNIVDYPKLDHFFRDWRENKVIQIDKGVLNILFRICQEAVDSNNFLEVQINSGYRTLKTNEYLRRHSGNVAKNSLHISGRAIDFKLANRAGQDVEKIADYMSPGGLGVYKSFLHIDTGPYRRWYA